MGHRRQIYVYKDLNYAASKTSTTVNTALNPADLRDGAIGVYGIHTAGSTNLNKLVLITDGGSESAGIVPAASFVGKEIFIAMGKSKGNDISVAIAKPSGLERSHGSVYVAPVLGVLRIGYNGTAGTGLNTPATINKGDDFTISLYNRNYVVSAGREPGQKISLSAPVAQNATDLQLLEAWVAAMNKRTDDILIDKAKIKILHNGSGAVFTTSATVAGVNGATTLTTSAAHGVTAGDAISLAGDYYVTTTGTTGSTLVLTRPFQGATGTIANADTLDITGAATEWGLELVDNKVGLNLEAAVQGVISLATIKSQTEPSPGYGSYDQVVAFEKDALVSKGTTDMITSYIPKDTIKAVSGTNYDLYTLTIHNPTHPNGDNGVVVFRVINYLRLAFVTGVADTTGFAQSDFEDIMTSLFTTFPAIS